MSMCIKSFSFEISISLGSWLCNSWSDLLNQNGIIVLSSRTFLSTVGGKSLSPKKLQHLCSDSKCDWPPKNCLKWWKRILALVLLMLACYNMASVAIISIFLSTFPSMRPFSMQTETKDSSNFENRTDSKHDAAFSAVLFALSTMHSNIASTTDQGFDSSSLYCSQVWLEGTTTSVTFRLFPQVKQMDWFPYSCTISCSKLSICVLLQTQSEWSKGNLFGSGRFHDMDETRQSTVELLPCWLFCTSSSISLELSLSLSTSMGAATLISMHPTDSAKAFVIPAYS